MIRRGFSNLEISNERERAFTHTSRSYAVVGLVERK